MPLSSSVRVFHGHKSPSSSPRNAKGLIRRAAAAALASGLLCALCSSPALGNLAYWDTNLTNIGAVNNSGTSANGIWGTGALWNASPDGTGTLSSWVSGDTAVFSAGTNVSGGLATGTNTITVEGTQTANQLTFEEGTNILSGGVITLQGAGTTPGVIQLSSTNTNTINSVLTGFNGITVNRTSLSGFVTFAAANTYFGPLTINAGRVNLNVNGAASTGPIIINIANNTGLSSTALPGSIIDVPNAITINSGSGADISASPGVTLSLTGKITGAGSWTHGVGTNNNGTIILNNATNDFTGGLTISAGTVIVTADHTLGTPGSANPGSPPANTTITGSGQLAFQSPSTMTYSTAEQLIINNLATAGLVQINNISGNNIFAGGVQFNQSTMNTIGVDAASLTLSGQVINAALGSKPFTKVGPGTLILTGENTTGFNSTVNINNGTLLLAGSTTSAGDIANATTVNINGSLLSLDNTAANNQDRIGNAATVNFTGGQLQLKGNSSEATREDVGILTFGAGEDVLSTITLSPNPAQPMLFVAGNMMRNSGGLMVFRSPGLGEAPGSGLGQIRFNTTPTLTGAGGAGVDKSIIAGALGATSGATGPELVTYDDALGVKPLGTLEYAPQIASGAQALNNVAIATPQPILADTTVNSIKIVDPNGSISLASGNLTVNSGMILASASSNDGISGAGSLVFPSATDGIIVGPGNLTVSSSINAPAAFIKAGTGTLTLSGANSLSTVYISGGTLLPTTTGALGDNSTVHVVAGGTLELPAGMNLSSADVVMHNGGRILGHSNASVGRNVRVSDGAIATIESPDVAGALNFNQPFGNAGTGAVRPTVILRGPGTINLAPSNLGFLGNFELRDNVTLPMSTSSDMLGGVVNTLIFGPGGGTLDMHSIPGGTTWGNPVVINGDANFHDASFNGIDVFGPLTINTSSTIHHILPKGINFLDPRLNFGSTILNASPTFNVDRPPIAGDYGRLTITNVKESNGPKNITKIGEGILNIAGAAGFTGDLNANEGIIIIPDSVPTISGATGEGQVIGAVNIKAGGHIDPGIHRVGSLLIDGVTISGAPSNRTQINMEGDAIGFDSLLVSGPDRFHIDGEATINLTNLGGVTSGEYILIDYVSTPIPDADFQKLSLASPVLGGFNASLVHDIATTQIRLRLEGAPPPQWFIDGNGTWGNALNWDPATVPDDPTASALFLDKITEPRTITLDGNKAAARLDFSNANTYTIASDATGSTLSLGSATSRSVINVNIGSHVISAPLTMNGDVLLNIAGGTSLALSGGLNMRNGKTTTMLAAGILEIAGPQSHDAGSLLELRAGTVKLKSNAGTPATSDNPAIANLSIKITGANSSVMLSNDQDLASIRVDYDQPGNQSFDIASPNAPGLFRSVRVYAADLASAKTSLYGAISTANVPGSPSPTDGIYDSGLVTHFGMKLGLAQLVDAHGDSYILIRPTRTGDLNLDGQVTISDFIDLASNFNQADATWQEGDMNYDGKVTISDFIDLASNFNGAYAGSVATISAEDHQLLAAFASSVGVDPSVIGSSVPEPAALSLLSGGLLLLARRRRK